MNLWGKHLMSGHLLLTKMLPDFWRFLWCVAVLIDQEHLISILTGYYIVTFCHFIFFIQLITYCLLILFYFAPSLGAWRVKGFLFSITELFWNCLMKSSTGKSWCLRHHIMCLNCTWRRKIYVFSEKMFFLLSVTTTG